MSAKPIVPRERANRDIEEAVDHYLGEAGERTAFGFIDALERAYRQIARRPAAGSARHSVELGLPGLRSWRLKRFPYLIFYVERDEYADVWRVLHGGRDMSSWMHEPDGS